MLKTILWVGTDEARISKILSKQAKTFSLIFFIILITSCNNGTKSESNGKDETKDSIYTYTNELINETSPYLLQHAKNPVNWKPWSNKVFREAAEKNKLVVLSIGYSTCHWCHVMEEESFEDVQVAKLMNDNFINIKVDREERPDLDKIYQTALQLVNGTGGWPMNAVILPNGKPVYLGTYHTKNDWMAILEKFKTEYTLNPEKMNEYATLLSQGVQEFFAHPEAKIDALVSWEKLNDGIRKWSNLWDLKWGGNQGREKFIEPPGLSMLLDYSFLVNDEKTRAHVLKTLDMSLQGGIYDHVGGGFFRYSTDAKWKVPHYEKMLYDNAQMIALLSKAYKVTGEEAYRKGVEETFNFLKRQMRNGEGGYYGALDADTDGEEGLFYLWTAEELKEVLGEDFGLFSEFYGINDEEKLDNGKYVLFTPLSAVDFSKRKKLNLQELNGKISRWKSTLLSNRSKRKEPAKDVKIITSWNALLMDALLEAYKAFGEESYFKEAISIFSYLESNNYKGKKLVHSFIGVKGQKEVFLEDYALFAKGALNLYEVTLDLKYLNIAKELMAAAEVGFAGESVMYYYNTDNHLTPKLINTLDSEIPSANSVMAQNLFRLGHLEYNTEDLEKAKMMALLVIDNFKEYAPNYGSWGSLLLQETYPYFEIAIVGREAKKIMGDLSRAYMVNTLLAGSTEDSDLALYKDRFFTDGTYIYVCKNNTCKLPVKSVVDALSLLEEMGHHEIRTSEIKEKF